MKVKRPLWVQRNMFGLRAYIDSRLIPNRTDSLHFYSLHTWRMLNCIFCYQFENLKFECLRLSFNPWVFKITVRLCFVLLQRVKLHNLFFRLLTDSPSMTVVQKQPKTISADELFTEDADTPASEIVYDVMNMPTNGRLVSAENITYPRSQVKYIRKCSFL